MHLEDMLRQSLAPRRLNELTRAAVAAIQRGRGSVRVRSLVSDLGTTERTLERAFEDSVGMGPKLLSRLVRFTHAISGDDDDLGYYDDPHRIHEFRAFSGVTPTAFRDEQNMINTAFVGNLQDATAVAM